MRDLVLMTLLGAFSSWRVDGDALALLRVTRLGPAQRLREVR